MATQAATHETRKKPSRASRQAARTAAKPVDAIRLLKEDHRQVQGWFKEFGKTEADAQRAFEEERLKFQTKPMLFGGASAFWSAKQGQLHALKGRTWLTVTVGTAKPVEREPEAARRLAEQLLKKL